MHAGTKATSALSSVTFMAFRRLTRHKISDRARERAWPRAEWTNYTNVTHRDGPRFAASPG